MDGYFVYFFYDSENNLLYVGKTVTLKNRMRQHFSKDILEVETWRQTIDRENIVLYQCINLTDLELYETYFINKYNPIYNLDKVYNQQPSFDLPYLKPIMYNYEGIIRRGLGTFKDYCIRYLEEPEEREEIAKRFPIIERTFNILGAKKIKALGCAKARFEQELEAYDNNETISEEIRKGFAPGFYIPSDIKVTLQSIYDNLGVVKKAKATDIEKVFNVKLQSKKSSGKVIKGYFIKEVE